MSELVGASQASANIPLEPSATNSQTIDVLQAASNFNPSAALCGDALPINGTILDPAISESNSLGGCAATNTDIGTYTVRSGDTISIIAQMFDISEITIKQANGLSGATIKPGQVLTILPRSGIIYTIKKGDSLSGVAKRYKVDIDDILSYNDISGSSLAIGTTIMIPDAEPLAADFSQTSGTKNGSASSGKFPRMMPNAFEMELDDFTVWPAYSGDYSCPIAPRAGRLTQGLHSHDAVDIAAPVGTSIRAFADGKVIIAKMNSAWNGGYGNYIVIAHSNGTQTLYAHMSAKSINLVSLGDTVSQGQTIGYVGMTGLTTGPHVHFEVRGSQNPCLSYR